MVFDSAAEIEARRQPPIMPLRARRSTAPCTEAAIDAAW
jgi:hypothetical protein